MPKGAKIFLIIVSTIIVVTIVAIFGLQFWARSGRLSDDESREMVLEAWRGAATSEFRDEGPNKIIEYKIGNQYYRVKPDYEAHPNLPAIELLIDNLFPDVPIEKAEEFLNTIDVHHAGQTRIAGVTVEKIDLSPTGYSGHTTELWIEPENNLLVGWRKLDENGELVRGWHYSKLGADDKKSTSDPPLSSADDEPRLLGGRPIRGIIDNLRESPLFEGRTLIPPDEVKAIAGNGPVLLPESVPEGFNLIGGRWINHFGPPTELEQLAPGTGLGRLRPGIGAGPLGGPGAGIGGGLGPGREGRGEPGQFQAIYSDGLNTISVIVMPHGRLGEAFLSKDKVDGIIRDKAVEMQRLFHTSMVGRMYPGRLVLIFGGVEKSVLQRMLDSIVNDEDSLVPPEPPPGEGDRLRDRLDEFREGEGPLGDRPGFGAGREGRRGFGRGR